MKFHCGIERSLTPESRQDCVWLLLCDDCLNNLRGNWLDIGGISEIRIGHDGSGI